MSQVPRQVLDDIHTVQANLRDFASRQLASLQNSEAETQPGGVLLGKRSIPVDATGRLGPQRPESLAGVCALPS